MGRSAPTLCKRYMKELLVTTRGVDPSLIRLFTKGTIGPLSDMMIKISLVLVINAKGTPNIVTCLQLDSPSSLALGSLQCGVLT